MVSEYGKLKFGEALRAWRRNAGLTQEQLATAVNLDKTTVSRWEHLNQAPDDRRPLASIARVLDCTELHLVNGTPPPIANPAAQMGTDVPAFIEFPDLRKLFVDEWSALPNESKHAIAIFATFIYEHALNGLPITSANIAVTANKAQDVEDIIDG